MMKKFLTVLTAVMLCTVHSWAAQTLVVNGQTVTKTVTRITFDGDNVMLTFVDEEQQMADMATVVLSFELSDPSAVYSLQGKVGSKLDLSGMEPGTEVIIYDATGKQVLRATAAETRAMLSTRGLKSGVYVMKAGWQVVKFVKR